MRANATKCDQMRVTFHCSLLPAPNFSEANELAALVLFCSPLFAEGVRKVPEGAGRWRKVPEGVRPLPIDAADTVSFLQHIAGQGTILELFDAFDDAGGVELGAGGGGVGVVGGGEVELHYLRLANFFIVARDYFVEVYEE